MSLKVKLDENLAETHAQLVRAASYECDRVTDEGLSGATDEALWERVVAEGRFFVTLDLDFSDVRRYTPGSHPGVLLLRPRSSSRDDVATVLGAVMSRHDLRDFEGCLVVADASRTRVRRPPGKEKRSGD